MRSVVWCALVCVFAFIFVLFAFTPFHDAKAVGSYSSQLQPATGGDAAYATTGDVNGDGYADLIFGAPGYSTQTGRVYLYYGSSSGTSSTPDITLTGETTTNAFGTGVASGDVNNDGYDDVIVGASTYSTNTGRVYVYYGGASMDTTADVTMTGAATNSYFGRDVSVGDINGDTYDDLMIGGQTYATSTGRVYVYYGGASMNSTLDVTLTSPNTADVFGAHVSSGDVNNDGYADVIVGADEYSSYKGRVYVYYGSSSLDTTADITLTGESASSFFGASVASGDVNNDGYADVIVGADGYSSYTGRVYAYYGGTSMDTIADIVITGENPNDFFGRSVATGDFNNSGKADLAVTADAVGVYVYLDSVFSSWPAPTPDPFSTSYTTKLGPNTGSSEGLGSSTTTADINKDGYDDLIVGTNYYNTTNVGHAYIYYGSSSGISTTADTTFTGENGNDDFGVTVATSDVNGDGNPDVIIAADAYSSLTGRVYVYYGNGTSSMDTTADVTLDGEVASDVFGYGIASGDVNHDEYDDVIVSAYGYSSYTGKVYVYYGGASMDATADATIASPLGAGEFFGNSVSFGGDVNNDGYKDLAVGVFQINDTGPGSAYIFYGGSSGVSSSPDITFTGENTSDYFGVSLAFADVNNDNYSDLVVGAYGYLGAAYGGRAYVYYGGSSMDSTADVTLDGDGGPISYALSLANIGDVNNDGYDDVAVGADGYSSYAGRAYIYYGGASMNSVVDMTLDGENGNDLFAGYDTPISSGDFNGDGAPDLVVGAPAADSGGNDGAVYVYINTAGYFVSTPTPSDSSSDGNGSGHDQGSEPEGPGYLETFFNVSTILQPTQVTTPNRPIQIKVKITRRDLTHITLLIGRKYYTLYDDGKHGDAKKGDHIFASNPVTFTHSMAYTIKPTYHTITVPVKGKVTVKK